MTSPSFKRTDETKRIVVDIETADPGIKQKGAGYVRGQGYILGIGIKCDDQSSEYYPIRHQDAQNVDAGQVSDYLHSIPSSTCIVGHNILYDVGWLNYEFGWFPKNLCCTLLTSQLENNSHHHHSLEWLSKHHGIGEKIEIDPNKLSSMPMRKVAQYCCQDVELTAKLDRKLWQYRDSEAAKREFALIPIMIKMKAKGIKIDLKRLEQLEKSFTKEFEQNQRLTGINNIWAAMEIAKLFNNLNLPIFKTKPTKAHPLGMPSFPGWYLESFDHFQVQALYRARQFHRLVNTFCVGIKENLCGERLHPDFFNGRSEYGGTVTGRFSSAHPNVQQIPHRTEEGMLLRSVFLPNNRFWYKYDYSQQEPRLMLHYASKLNLRDIQKWRDLYINPNADFYEPIQKSMGIERFPAKTITLATCYNMGFRKLARMMHISEEQAQQYLIAYRRSVPWLAELKRYCEARIMERGFVKTYGGRQLHLPRANASDSFNHLIQGSAADQIKEAMVQIYQKFDLVPMLQVHDELAYDLDEGEVNDEKDLAIKEVMTKVFQLDFPTKVDMTPGLNWRQCG